jgi:hypothetical protein
MYFMHESSVLLPYQSPDPVDFPVRVSKNIKLPVDGLVGLDHPTDNWDET